MYELAPFADIPLDDALLEHLLDEHQAVALPRYERLWRYFRNDLAPPHAADGSDRAPAQRTGLPQRLRIRRSDRDDRFEREIVIENDIAWRIHALVDFMFPSPPRFISRASDPETRRRIEDALEAAFDANGGISLWQEAALLGSVYGHVDLLLDASELFEQARGNFHNRNSKRGTRPGEAASDTSSLPGRGRPGAALHIEAVEAPRAVPLLNESDFRELDAHIVHYERPAHAVKRESALGRLLTRRFARRALQRATRESVTVTEIRSATHVQRYENGALVSESRNPLGRIPVVHIQNLAQPFVYEGLSDVEPLIPLQDELNTRLSDRANRVTMQSFRMWLGKGIDGFTDRSVGPGQMWMTDNPDASIEAFGGDADSPSERAHIEELREALDKASGVTPAAAGHIKAKVGNLTSENALRISLMGTIAKVKRKRITYGNGIRALGALILHALDLAGTLRTTPADREIDIAWPDPLPNDESRRIKDALAKAQLGVPEATLRAELGYADP